MINNYSIKQPSVKCPSVKQPSTKQSPLSSGCSHHLNFLIGYENYCNSPLLNLLPLMVNQSTVLWSGITLAGTKQSQ